MWVDAILFAARHHASHDDGAGAILGLIVIVVVLVIFAFRAATARYDLIQRDGLPFCPRCNRQVSLRREYCRACGYRFVTYGSSPARPPEPSPGALARVRSQRARRTHLAEEESRRREEERRRAAQEAEKRSALTVLNIEVGEGPPPLPKPRVSLLERYRALPDLAQAAVMGLGIAIPAIVLLCLAFGFPKTESPAPSADLVLPAGTPALPADATVYVTRRGTRYHKEGCAELLGMGTSLAFREAVGQFVPCRQCWLDPGPVATVPTEKVKVDPKKADPIVALAAIPNADRKKESPLVAPNPAVAPAAVDAVPAALAPPAPVVIAAPAPPVRVPAVRAPKLDFRRTAYAYCELH
jgi:hypothetical protein